MLKYNFMHLFAKRAIKNKNAFLHKAGFNRQTASRIASNRFSALKLSQVEKLCLAFNCTPNDLIEYTPDEKNKNTNHPLTKLTRTAVPEQLANIVDDIPIDKLNDFTQQIKTLKTQLLTNT